jgi:hypothetical protein
MNTKLDNYLVSKYPKIFINRYESPMVSCLYFGFEHGDGWFWLLDQLCDSIQNYIDINNKYKKEDEKKIPQVIATQVKEKFGVLNFYFSGGDEFISGMVQLAENMSSNTCEFCGSVVNVGKTSGWISTICKNCYDTSDDRISKRNWSPNQSVVIENELIIEKRKIKIDKINNVEE